MALRRKRRGKGGALGDLDLAKDHIGIATALYREMEMPIWVQEAEA